MEDNFINWLEDENKKLKKMLLSFEDKPDLSDLASSVRGMLSQNTRIQKHYQIMIKEDRNEKA